MAIGRIPALILAGAALVAIGAAPKSIGWNSEISAGADGSHVMGNPEAKVRITEYVSYTCKACSAFAVQSEAPLRIGYISSGKVSFEVRQILRGPVDLTIAMLAECGTKERFFMRHTGFLRRQASWMKPVASASPAQQQRWKYGTLAQRNRAIASDLRLYDLMEGMGINRNITDRCLTDQAVAERITAQSNSSQALGITNPPGLAINEKLLDGVTTWAELRPLIDKSL